MGTFYFNNYSFYYFNINNDYSFLKIFAPDEVFYDDYMGIKRTILKTTVKNAKTRLELLGYNEDTIKSYILHGVNTKIIEMENDYEIDMEFISLLKKIDYKSICYALKKCLDMDGDELDTIKSKISPTLLEAFIQENQNYDEVINQLLKYMLINDYPTAFIIDHNNLDMCCDLYLMLSNIEDDYIIEYYDSIINGEKTKFTIDKINDYYTTLDKTIILTEGKTDNYSLKKSLNILFPYLSHLISFFNFRVSDYGGADYLVNILKAFSGAGIKNNIIAIFDNDIAARNAIHKID